MDGDLKVENINKQIEELQKKANRYDNLKERNQKYIKTINHIIETLTELKKEIDPFITTQDVGKRKNFADIRKDIFNRLEGGEEFTIEKIENEFTIENKQAYHIVRELIKNKNIAKRNEGRKIFIFANKTV